MSLPGKAAEALRILGSRSSWHVTDLPPQIDETVLRVLDARGSIECCTWECREKNPRPLEDPSANPDDYVIARREPVRWFSPQADQGKVANVGEDQWSCLLDASRYPPELSPELRLTLAGKAALAELKLGEPQRAAVPAKDKGEGRMKREVAEPLIGEHLMGRPHDTAQQVAGAVGCSVGVVAESSAWKLNQKRLRIARQQGIDPKAVKLDEKAISAAGGDRMTQLHHHRQQTDATIDELDEQQRELFHRVAEYQKGHPDATDEQVASAVGCTAGDVERRQAELDRLATEQAKSEKEDIDVEDPATKRGKRRKWVEKQV